MHQDASNEAELKAEDSVEEPGTEVVLSEEQDTAEDEVLGRSFEAELVQDKAQRRADGDEVVSLFFYTGTGNGDHAFYNPHTTGEQGPKLGGGGHVEYPQPNRRRVVARGDFHSQ